VTKSAWKTWTGYC